MLTCNVPDVPVDRSNLVLKVSAMHSSLAQPSVTSSSKGVFDRGMHNAGNVQALDLFRRHTGTDMQFQVHLQKQVPAGEEWIL